MKKIISISLILVCIVMVFVAGCSSSEPTTTAPAPAPVTTVKTTRATTIPTAALVLSTSPSHFSGTGDDVVSFTATESGLRVFAMSYTGKSNFAIWLIDSNGDKIDLLVNKIGAYSGKKSDPLTTGKYTLDVTASGAWSVDISNP